MAETEPKGAQTPYVMVSVQTLRMWNCSNKLELTGLNKPHPRLFWPKGWKSKGCGTTLWSVTACAACPWHEELLKVVVLEVGDLLGLLGRNSILYQNSVLILNSYSKLDSYSKLHPRTRSSIHVLDCYSKKSGLDPSIPNCQIDMSDHLHNIVIFVLHRLFW